MSFRSGKSLTLLASHQHEIHRAMSLLRSGRPALRFRFQAMCPDDYLWGSFSDFHPTRNGIAQGRFVPAPQKSSISAFEVITGRVQCAAQSKSGNSETPIGSGQATKARRNPQTHGSTARRDSSISGTQQRRGKKRHDKFVPPATRCVAMSNSGCEARDLRETSVRADKRAANA